MIDSLALGIAPPRRTETADRKPLGRSWHLTGHPAIEGNNSKTEAPGEKTREYLFYVTGGWLAVFGNEKRRAGEGR